MWFGPPGVPLLLYQQYESSYMQLSVFAAYTSTTHCDGLTEHDYIACTYALVVLYVILIILHAATQCGEGKSLHGVSGPVYEVW